MLIMSVTYKPRCLGKSTATNSLLLAQSQHPRSLVAGIPIGQYLRLRRNCSTIEEFTTQSKELRSRFLNRGYSIKTLNKAYHRALHSDRASLLSSNKEKVQDKTIRVIGTFNKRWWAIKQIFARHWHLLQADDDLAKVIGPRPIITSRRSRNLRDSLVNSHFQRARTTTWLSPVKGMYRCQGCKACRHINVGKTFANHDNTSQFCVDSFINCRTTNVIYFITCNCGKRYVGKTTRQLRRRVLEHINSIKHSAETSVARHVTQCHDGDINAIKFMGIYQLKCPMRGGNTDQSLLRIEAEWIYKLKTRSPNGLNEGFTFTPFI
ncbi:hypothetical protein FKM82_022987 [Ascaphus truei]